MDCTICKKSLRMLNEVKYWNGFANKDYIQKIGYCDNCDFVTTLNPISYEEQKWLYNGGDDYSNFSSKNIEKDNNLIRIRKMKSTLDALELNINTVFDVGAHNGELLDYFKKHGKQIFGCDTSEQGIQNARERYGIELILGDLHSVIGKCNLDKYDLVSVCHVMEHIVDLDEFCRDLASLTDKYIYIEVPCVTERKCGEPFGFFAEEHINYFSPYSMTVLMEKHGFDLVEMQIDHMIGFKIENGFPMIRAVYKKGKSSTIVRSLINSDEVINKYFYYSKNIMDNIDNTIKTFENKKIAVFGASFQLNRLIAYTSLRNMDITCIIDNSKEKQGRYYHIGEKAVPIVSPMEAGNYSIEYLILASWNNHIVMKKQAEELGIAEEIVLLPGQEN